MTENAVKIVECPRDAWQGLARQIPAETKAEYLRALVGVGFKQIDAVSFVSPRAVPQMADSEDVLKRLDPPDDVEIIGIVVNEKGAERALATEAVRTLGFPYSISETFLKKNQNQIGGGKQRRAGSGLAQGRGKRAGDGGLRFDGVWQSVRRRCGTWMRFCRRCRTLPTWGSRRFRWRTPWAWRRRRWLRKIVGAVVEEFDYIEVGAHLHGRKEDAAAKVLAAYDAGCRRFDSALGGLGGCPFAQDALVGNVPTEVVLRTLAEHGAQVPIRKPLENVLRMNEDIALRFAR